MVISSRTPDGTPFECPICHKSDPLEACYPGGDSVCPSCGNLLWLFRNQVTKKTDVLLEDINLDTLLRDELGVDSLDLVELVMDVEEQFGISGIAIPQDIVEQFKSVRDVIEYLRSRQER